MLRLPILRDRDRSEVCLPAFDEIEGHGQRNDDYKHNRSPVETCQSAHSPGSIRPE